MVDPRLRRTRGHRRLLDRRGEHEPKRPTAPRVTPAWPFRFKTSQLARRQSQGVSDEHLAMLASGVAATCAGLHGMSFRFPPDPLPESEADDDDVGIGIYTYHPAVLGNAGPLSAEGDALRKALFFNRPCRCGYHEAKSPPLGKTQIVRHNAWAVGRDARRFASPAVEVAEAILAARADRARRQRAQLQMSRLHAGFTAIPQEAQELRQRPDADDGRAALARPGEGCQGSPLGHCQATKSRGFFPSERGVEQPGLETLDN